MTESFDMNAAIEAAMEAETKAEAFYRDAAAKATDPRGRDFLTQLADFERGHFAKLAELRDSLAGGGGYVAYDGQQFNKAAVPAEVEGQVEGGLDDLLGIIQLAIDAETKAFERYRAMAEATDDETGRAMFLRLADEEVLHRRILADEFYHLNNQGGVWIWGD